MLQFKELRKLLKKDLTDLLSIKIALVGDTATQFLATAIKLRIHLILLKNNLNINQKFIREFEVNIFFAIFAIETTVSETVVSETVVSEREKRKDWANHFG